MKFTIWINSNHSDLYQYLYPSQCESFRTNPKNVLHLLSWKTIKNRSELIRTNPSQFYNPNQSESFRFIPISVFEPMRIIPNQSEKRFASPFMKNDQKSIRINPNKSESILQSQSIWIIPIYTISVSVQCESLRTTPKNVLFLL